MLIEIESAIMALEEGVRPDAVAERLREVLDELRSEPTNVQALALARLMRDRPDSVVTVNPNPFDLPEGYWQAWFPATPSEGFMCGIAPDGSVSS